MNPYTPAIIDIQRQLFAETGLRTDVYYKEGYGALFVFEGASLHPNNVIYAVDEIMLALRSR